MSSLDLIVATMTPLLSKYPPSSTMPKYNLVAPVGTTNVCVVPEPVPVRPSPMKKIWFNPGEIELKLVPLRAPGMGPDGTFGPRKTPARPPRNTLVAPEILMPLNVGI